MSAQRQANARVTTLLDLYLERQCDWWAVHDALIDADRNSEAELWHAFNNSPGGATQICLSRNNGRVDSSHELDPADWLVWGQEPTEAFASGDYGDVTLCINAFCPPEEWVEVWSPEDDSPRPYSVGWGPLRASRMGRLI